MTPASPALVLLAMSAIALADLAENGMMTAEEVCDALIDSAATFIEST